MVAVRALGVSLLILASVACALLLRHDAGAPRGITEGRWSPQPVVTAGR